jgi:hypothetical protein
MARACRRDVYEGEGLGSRPPGVHRFDAIAGLIGSAPIEDARSKFAS